MTRKTRCPRLNPGDPPLNLTRQTKELAGRAKHVYRACLQIFAFQGTPKQSGGGVGSGQNGASFVWILIQHARQIKTFHTSERRRLTRDRRVGRLNRRIRQVDTPARTIAGLLIPSTMHRAPHQTSALILMTGAQRLTNLTSLTSLTILVHTTTTHSRPNQASRLHVRETRTRVCRRKEREKAMGDNMHHQTIDLLTLAQPHPARRRGSSCPPARRDHRGCRNPRKRPAPARGLRRREGRRCTPSAAGRRLPADIIARLTKEGMIGVLVLAGVRSRFRCIF